MTIQEKQTALFNDLGVFFAFSNEQFAKSKQPNVDYCSVLGAGDCVPVDNAQEFYERYSALVEEHRKQELAEKGIDKLIEEQLVNHECFYTGSVDNAVDALACYNVTHEQAWAIYNKISHKFADW